jgi:hypothetical protein
MVVAEAAAAGNEMSLSNMVLGFYEEAERERWTEEAADTAAAEDGSDDEGSSSGGGSAESRAFWQEQRSLLHVSSLLHFLLIQKQISVAFFSFVLINYG